VAALGSRPRFPKLKELETHTPAALKTCWAPLDRATQKRLTRAHSKSSSALFLLPLVIPGFILNCPVFLTSYLVSKKLADGPNVIALWKILAGTAAAAIWIPGMIILAAYLGWLPLLSYAASTVMTIQFWSSIRAALRALRLRFAPQRTGKIIRMFLYSATRHEQRLN